jgi:hypothetical protein
MSSASRTIRVGATAWLIFQVAVLAVLVPAIVAAQPPKLDTDPPADGRERARVVALEGIERLKHEDWEGAHEKLSEAYALFPAPTVAVLDAGALEKLGRWVEAQTLYGQAAEMTVGSDSPEPFRRAVEKARQQRDRLEQAIPTLAVALQQARTSHELRINGSALPRKDWGRPRKIDPGSCTISIVEPGAPTVSDQVMVHAGDRLRVVLVASGRPKPAAPVPRPSPAPEAPSRALAWASLGIGAAGLTTGVVAGAVMLGAKADLDDQCRPECPPSARDTLDRFRTSRLVSAVGYSAGTVGLGFGLWLLLDRPEQSTPRWTGSAAWSPGETRLQFRGAF